MIADNHKWTTGLFFVQWLPVRMHASEAWSDYAAQLPNKTFLKDSFA